MKMKQKWLLILAALTLGTTGALAAAHPVAAAANYNVKGANQPYFHGFNAEQMLNWSPETDPSAKYFVSDVSLQPRNPKFAATQAQPDLQTNAQVLTLAGDYGDPGYGQTPGIPDFTRTVDAFSRHIFEYWQYIDFYGSWNGTPIGGNSYDDIRNNAATLQYGVINYPNPAYTDAAHQNGVKSLGGWFWPRPENFSAWVQQRADGTFPVADKMIAMARYMNFDGYFINQEATISSTDAAQLQKMLVYMKQKAPDLYIQFYDSLQQDGQLTYGNGFNTSNAYWLKADNGSAADSLFLNYAWNTTRLNNGVATAQKLGLDPLKAIFAGTENQKYGFNPPYDPRQIFPNKTTTNASWGLFGTDFAYSRYPGNNLDNNSQGAIDVRARQYWSGPNQDPTKTGRLTEVNSAPYPDKGVPNDADNPAHWDGVANFIPEKSVISQTPFYTNFNTGHGLGFYQGGQQVSQQEWSNIGIQNLLPTWQWWTTGGPQVNFDYTDAYDGGNSLKIVNTTGQSTINLFKTDLAVTKATKLTLHFKNNAPLTLKVQLTFKDDPAKPVSLNVAAEDLNTWQAPSLNLAQYSGRAIAKIALAVTSSKNATLNLGDFSVQTATPSTTAPTALTVDRYLPTTGEAFVTLNMTDQIKYYDLYTAEGQFISRVNSTKAYVDHVPANATALVAQPIGTAGQTYAKLDVPLKLR
ncbi:hypothetical protein FC83_GL002060 [Agrilactobacillus composti DSM 18527 = JCM 14202]|uniref:Cytosolic endo-beta-N-acetylglucosaminidase TIM barrel domain-containing protein n=2 Tax=Agrilactobacillus TaxID=2767875 RepID=A0A0R1XXP6_9LACO|nr:hypothetical protein FC83_GL002060 [Agrilactobacillus composti DSM 18527 = JCM 14202]